MVVIYTYKGNMPKELLRDEVIDRYNNLSESTTYVRLFYEDGVPYMTDNKSISISHTRVDEHNRIELIAIADEPIGIDIEPRIRPVNMGIARRYYTRSEQEYVGGDSDRLLEVWQKKEAKGKAEKIGLYLDDVLSDDAFREYDIFDGYRVVLYGGEKQVVFVTI